MHKNYKVAIVGGGAAGLLTAVELTRGNNALLGKDIVVFEKNDRVGKKLIATGNGQGNLFNANFGEQFYHGEREFIQEFVSYTKNLDIENYFYELGIPVCTDSSGKKYPLSKQASAVLDVLRIILDKNRVENKTSCAVEKIKKRAVDFEIVTQKGVFYADNVVLAVGGMAQKQFGTDGSAYALAKDLGHTLTPTYPSLVQLKTQTDKIRGLKGLKENARVRLKNGDKTLACAMGDLLFTDYGVSGNAVFSVSGYATQVDSPVLDVEFLPQLTFEQVVEILNKREEQGLFKGVDKLFGILNKRIGQAVIKSAKSDSPQDIASALKSFKLNITGNLGFNYAQVTKGGVLTQEIDCKTLQSKVCKQLYLVGELLDVDGDCGGYNLTFAFSCGIRCAQFIKKNTTE